MKNLLLLLLFILLAVGCDNNQSTQYQQHQYHSRTYTITLYNANGGIIQQWDDAKEMQFYSGSTCYFKTSGAVTMRINGTIIVQSK